MKRLLWMALLIVCAAVAKSQDFGTYAIGVNGCYGVNSDYKHFSVGLKVQGFIGDHWRADISGTYMPKAHNVSMWDLNANMHYVFALGKKVGLYPLAGITFLHAKLHGINDIPEDYSHLIDLSGIDGYGDDDEARIGVNAGIGAEYYITLALKVNAEIKYQYAKDFDRPVFSIGLSYVW